MRSKGVVILNEFIQSRQNDFPYASGELSGLLSDIGLAAKLINREVNKAGLVDILGITDQNNSSGETVQKLDMFAHKVLVSSLTNSGECCGIASEEAEDFITFNSEHSNAKYVVCFDPLDGSSNIDVNVSVGTIFAIYRRKSQDKDTVKLSDFLQKGSDLVAAGYVIYGSSTMLVYTTGYGVNGFTLDPSIGEFCLSHPDIKIPEKGSIYSINESYFCRFPQAVRDFVVYCKTPDEAGKAPYNSRYIGSMVSDVHRNLIKGGIFMYPQMEGYPNGKLRILFECNPMAFIVEQAGGAATTGTTRILDIEPTALHQRCPIFIGSKDMVAKAQHYIARSKTLTNPPAIEQQLNMSKTAVHFSNL